MYDHVATISCWLGLIRFSKSFVLYDQENLFSSMMSATTTTVTVYQRCEYRQYPNFRRLNSLFRLDFDVQQIIFSCLLCDMKISGSFSGKMLYSVFKRNSRKSFSVSISCPIRQIRFSSKEKVPRLLIKRIKSSRIWYSLKYSLGMRFRCQGLLVIPHGWVEVVFDIQILNRTYVYEVRWTRVIIWV